jgi:uncharacterized membrane protein YgcG
MLSTEGLIIAMMPLLAFMPLLTAQVPVIDDTAHIFIAREMTEIAGMIEKIENDFHVRVVVDTVKFLPWAARLWISIRGPDAAERYLDNWAHGRARKAGTRGIYILVCREPLAVRVQAGRGLRGITAADTNHLKEILVAGLSRGDPGKALKETVEELDKVLQSRLGGSAAGLPAISWPTVAAAIVLVLALWLTIELLGRSGGRNRKPPLAPTMLWGTLPVVLYWSCATPGLRDEKFPVSQAPPDK